MLQPVSHIITSMKERRAYCERKKVEMLIDDYLSTVYHGMQLRHMI